MCQVLRCPLTHGSHTHCCLSILSNCTLLSGAISPVHTGTVVALFTIAKDIGDEHRAQNEQLLRAKSQLYIKTIRTPQGTDETGISISIEKKHVSFPLVHATVQKLDFLHVQQLLH